MTTINLTMTNMEKALEVPNYYPANSSSDDTINSSLYQIKAIMGLIDDGDYSVWRNLTTECRKLYQHVSMMENANSPYYLNTHCDTIFVPSTSADEAIMIILPIPEIRAFQ